MALFFWIYKNKAHCFFGIYFILVLFHFIYLGITKKSFESFLEELKEHRMRSFLPFYALILSLVVYGTLWDENNKADGFYPNLQGIIKETKGIITFATELPEIGNEDSRISKIMGSNGINWYQKLFYLCAGLSVVSALLLGSTFFVRQITNRLNRRKWKKAKQKVIVFGCNQENIHFCETANMSGSKSLLVNDDKTKSEELTGKSIAYMDTISLIGIIENNSETRELVKMIRKQLDEIFDDSSQKTKKCHLTLIINTGDEEVNRALALFVYNEINRYLKPLRDRINTDEKGHIPEIRKIMAADERFFCAIYGSAKFTNMYDEIQRGSCGMIRYLSSAVITADDFLLRYPITEFMTGVNAELIDTERKAISPDTVVNLVFLGWNEINEQIILNYVKTSSEIPVSRLNILLFDKNAPDEKENFRLPKEVQIFREDPENSKVWDAIQEKAQENKSLTHLIIAVGSDSENIHLARLLSGKFQNYDENQRIKIFSHVRGTHKSLSDIFAENGEWIPFGNENERVYSLSAISALYHSEDKTDHDHPIQWYQKRNNITILTRKEKYKVFANRSHVHLTGLEEQTGTALWYPIVYQRNFSVYISYANGDENAAAELCELLAERGIYSIRKASGKEIPLPDKARKIEDAKAFVLIMDSEDKKIESPYSQCREELRLANRYGKPVIIYQKSKVIPMEQTKMFFNDGISLVYDINMLMDKLNQLIVPCIWFRLNDISNETTEKYSHGKTRKLTIGKNENADIRLPDEHGIGNINCEIFVQGGQCFLTCQSGHGTEILDDQKVRIKLLNKGEHFELRSQNIICIGTGPILYQFQIEFPA